MAFWFGTSFINYFFYILMIIQKVDLFVYPPPHPLVLDFGPKLPAYYYKMWYLCQGQSICLQYLQ